MWKQAGVTASLTLLGGTFLFLLSEFIRGYVVSPSIKVREHLGLIIDRVIFYENHLTSHEVTDQLAAQISIELRSASTQLRSKAEGVMWYSLCARLMLVPSKERIDKISRELMGLSNSVPVVTVAKGIKYNSDDSLEKNIQSIERLGEALKFKFH